MATASVCGSTGNVTGTGAVEISFWEITLTQDAVEATSFASAGWHERVACLLGATGNFRSIGGSSTVGAHTAAFTATGLSIGGDILISKITVSTPVDGIVTFNHEFSFTGAITATAS